MSSSKMDLFRHYEIENNPKVKRCFSLALGCGCDLGKVVDCVEDVVNLMND